MLRSWPWRGRAAITIERYVTLSLESAKNRKVWNQLQPVLVDGDFEKARELAAKDDSAICQLLNMGLARQGAVRRREDIEIAMDEHVRITPQLEKRRIPRHLREPRRCWPVGTVSG
jgi:biopolymer transport protein ExbB